MRIVNNVRYFAAMRPANLDAHLAIDGRGGLGHTMISYKKASSLKFIRCAPGRWYEHLPFRCRGGTGYIMKAIAIPSGIPVPK